MKASGHVRSNKNKTKFRQTTGPQDKHRQRTPDSYLEGKGAGLNWVLISIFDKPNYNKHCIF